MTTRPQSTTIFFVEKTKGRINELVAKKQELTTELMSKGVDLWEVLSATASISKEIRYLMGIIAPRIAEYRTLKGRPQRDKQIQLEINKRHSDNPKLVALPY